MPDSNAAFQEAGFAQAGARRQATAEENAAARASQSTAPVCCTSPEQVFGLASAFSVFLWSHLTMLEVQTLINLLTMLIVNLSTLVIQKQICEGVVVTPGE